MVYNGPSVEEKLNEKASVLMVRVKNYQYVLDGNVLTITEQMKGLEQLQEKLNALEKLYMVIFKEQRGRAGRPFDYKREVDKLIYECGQSLDELKEQAEQMSQDQPTWEAPPSTPPPPHPTPPSVSSEDGRWRLPQQDDVISPEMDGWFIGLERCSLTPAAGPSPLHQGASRRTGTSSGVRGHKVSRGRSRSSRSVDVQRSRDVSLDIFLNNMELTSHTE
ncbi:unnamed protein product [Pleuronectes platessa]|uniref:Uncharacterized protein n=1 Tax=Pleuronectes platessa TaxID=8262 RepID=A0A9N7YL70_PLEPL|nr:unnamed protein product [Pleuronectes platessa]